jgi:hypothetical protein
MNEDKDGKIKHEENEEVFEKELDEEALDVIKRLYDKTFKELVHR